MGKGEDHLVSLFNLCPNPHDLQRFEDEGPTSVTYTFRKANMVHVSYAFVYVKGELVKVPNFTQGFGKKEQTGNRRYK